jgi:hypothetical protein
MAQASPSNITRRFHNLSNEMLADAIGHADAVLKGAESEAKALKEEFKRRGLLDAAGEHFAVRASEQISGRLDAKAVREFLGDRYHRFEQAVVSTVIRIRAVERSAAAA